MRLNNPSFPRNLSPTPIGERGSRSSITRHYHENSRFHIHTRPRGPSAIPENLVPDPNRGAGIQKLNNPSFPRKREPRKVGCWRVQLYETGSLGGFRRIGLANSGQLQSIKHLAPGGGLGVNFLSPLFESYGVDRSLARMSANLSIKSLALCTGP